MKERHLLRYGKARATIRHGAQYAPFVQQNWLADVTNESGTQLMQALPGLTDLKLRTGI